APLVRPLPPPHRKHDPCGARRPRHDAPSLPSDQRRERRPRGTLMLISLLRRYLPTYRTEVAIVTVLLLIQSIANLYLPNLNADIINNGVAKGDTDYIWRTGAVMLGVTLVLGVLAIV